MNLAQLQTLMLDAVIRDEKIDSRLGSLISSTRGIGPETRLRTYRDNVEGVHLEALDAAYPVTREVLGSRYWQQLLIQEIPAFGSPLPDLHEYGDFMPELLTRAQKSHKELADFEYLGELAQLEWQVHLVQFKTTDPDFDWAAFRAFDPKRQMRVRFTLSHALKRMRFSQPVDALWHSHQGNQKNLPPQTSPACCVYREKSFDVAVARLSERDWNLLEAISADRSLADLPAENLETTVQTLHHWIEHGWITGFREP